MALFLAIMSVALLFGQDRQTGARLHDIQEWLEAYDKVFQAGDITRLSAFFAEDAILTEGDMVTTWLEVRDHRAKQSTATGLGIEARHVQTRIRFLGATGTAAGLTGLVDITTKSDKPTVRRRVAETMLIERGGDTGWLIRLLHRSSSLE